MSGFGRDVMRSMGDYFSTFDERAGEPRPADNPEEDRNDASCGFCLAALVTAFGFLITAASASAATPF